MLPKLTFVNRINKIKKNNSNNSSDILFLLSIVVLFIGIILYFRYKEKNIRKEEKKEQITKFINEINNFYINN